MEEIGREVIASRVIEELASAYFFERFRRRLDGLTDDEYLWEPVPGCLSVPSDGGALPRDGPIPLTTIAWRICHIGEGLRQERNWRWLGRTVPDHGSPMAWPRTASAGIRYVEDGWAAWSELVHSVSLDDMWQPLGPVAGPYADLERFTLVLHVLDELIHHAAEVGVLRDLFSATMSQA